MSDARARLSSPTVTIWKRIEISAAHHIPNHPGKCRHPHGHNYVIEVGIRGPVNSETGMVKDFFEVKQDLVDIIDRPCDHKDLNEVYPDMLTTAENLASCWLYDLRERDRRYQVVRVYETSTSWVEATV